MTVSIIPLAHAVLCEDCQHVTDTTGSLCLRCGSRALHNVSTWLDREERPEPMSDWQAFNERKRRA